MTMTREEVESLLSRAPEGPWRADGEPWNRIVWSWAENRVCFMAHSNGLNDDRDVAASDLAAAAPDLARALLAALDDLDAVKAERDKWHDLAAANGRAALDELAQVVAAEARAEAAEAANAAMTAREGVLQNAATLAMSDLEMAFKSHTSMIELTRLGTGACLRLRAALQHKDDTHGPE